MILVRGKFNWEPAIFFKLKLDYCQFKLSIFSLNEQLISYKLHSFVKKQILSEEKMKIKLLILGIFLTLFSGCGKSPKEIMRNGQEHLLNGKYDLALKSFQIVFEKHPQNSLADSAGYQIARVYLDYLKDYDSGYKTLNSLGNNYPDSKYGIRSREELRLFPDWLFTTAEAERDAKDINGSVETLDYLVNKFPSHEIAPKAQYLIGDIYMNDQRNFELAIDSYRKIIQDFPGSKQEPHAQFMIGYIYANVLDDSSKARLEYNLFLEKYPDHELTPSVKFELDFIGKDINDIPQLKHITS